MLLFNGEGLIVHELVDTSSEQKEVFGTCPFNHPIRTLVVQVFLELLAPWAGCTIVPCWAACTIFLWPVVQLFHVGPVVLNETLPPPALSSHTQVEKTWLVRC